MYEVYEQITREKDSRQPAEERYAVVEYYWRARTLCSLLNQYDPSRRFLWRAIHGPVKDGWLHIVNRI